MALDLDTVVRHYGDPDAEVHACRTACALFDFSFLARARLHGPGSLTAISQLTRRPLGDLAPGRIRYAVREDPQGHVVTDLTVWRHAGHYEVMSGRSEDIADLVRAAPENAGAEDLSGSHATFAVQGPQSLAVLARHMDVAAVSRLAYFAFTCARIGDVPCLVGRLGYTGEPGFEIVLPRAAADETWHRLARDARPAGFIAADILRIEAGFVLFANELRVRVSASEAGLAPFGGARTEPSERDIALVCFRAETRENPVLWQPAGPIDRPGPGMITITSACHSRRAGGTLGLGFARQADVIAGVPLRDPRGTFAGIRLASLPFFDPHKRRPRAALAPPPS